MLCILELSKPCGREPLEHARTVTLDGYRVISPSMPGYWDICEAGCGIPLYLSPPPRNKKK